MQCAKLPVPPSLVIAKAKQIAQQLSIPEGNFKASWQWLKVDLENVEDCKKFFFMVKGQK